MSGSGKKKQASRKGGTPPPASRGKAAKPPPPAADRQSDAEAIERAVYDGMQDLRANKTR